MGRPVVMFELGCGDKERTRAFYTQLFDWTSEPYGPLANRFDTGSAQGIQGFATSLGHEPHQYVLFYVEVDDIPAHLAKAEALGGKTFIPRAPVPGGGHFAWLRDPDGNLVGLFEPAAK